MRRDILSLLCKKEYNDEYRFYLTTDDVERIIELLKSYDSNSWEDSIWDWDDEEWPYSEKVKQDIENLKTLRELMDKYELEVYFYDSY